MKSTFISKEIDLFKYVIFISFLPSLVMSTLLIILEVTSISSLVPSLYLTVILVPVKSRFSLTSYSNLEGLDFKEIYGR